VDWKRYKRLMVDPVAVCLHPEAPERIIQPEELARLTAYFRRAVIEAVQDTYPVVETPGEDVLRIRAAITDVIPANAALNVVTTLGVMLPLDMGGASMEAELLDSLSGEVLGAVVDTKRGTPLDVIGGFTRWGHAKSALRGWARELRKTLDAI